MCYISEGAQDYINKIDSIEHQYDYECIACKEGFDTGFGVKIEDEKFCNNCLENNNHLEFYQNAGVDDSDILEITNQITQL